MKDSIKEVIQKIAKVIDVKSLVTLTLVAVLAILTLRGQAASELFSSAVMLVLGFFFGKNTNGGGDK